MIICQTAQALCRFLTHPQGKTSSVESLERVKIEQLSKKIQTLTEETSSLVENAEKSFQKINHKHYLNKNFSKEVHSIYCTSKKAANTADQILQLSKILFETENTSQSVKIQVDTLKRLSGKAIAEAALSLQNSCWANCLQNKITNPSFISIKTQISKILSTISFLDLLQILDEHQSHNNEIKQKAITVLKALENESTPQIETNELKIIARAKLEIVCYEQTPQEIQSTKDAITNLLNSFYAPYIEINSIYFLAETIFNESKNKQNESFNLCSCINALVRRNSRSSQITPES